MNSQRLASAGVLLMGLMCTAVDAQDFPNRPLRIVTDQTGGGLDFAARLIAPGLSATVGQSVVVDNRGGGVTASAEIVSRSRPDGYTLMLYGSSVWLMQFLRKEVSWDAFKDFSPITIALSSPSVLVVHQGVAATSVKELIALAKARPGELNYASGGPGSSPHMGAELFRTMAGISVVHVPYKGGGPALNDLLGGRVHLMFPSAASVTPHLKSGRIRALAVTSAKPSALFPELATVSASGLPGYEWSVVTALFAPARTPSSIVQRLNQEIVHVINRPDIKEKFLGAGSEAVGGTPDQLSAMMEAETRRMGPVIQAAGIRSE